MTSQLWDADAAARYDETSGDMYAPEVLGPAVDFLADLAPGGRALEFAIGTGRVALPLRDRGLTVAGIEMSEPMAAMMRGKPGADEVDVVIGDMATTAVEGEFDLVYLVYNAISNLLEQSSQVACFRNAARHLRPGGRFVVELWVPELRLLPPGAVAVPFLLTEEHIGFDTYDLLTQRCVSHHYWISGGVGRSFESHHRYAWPSELDLMAELAGLQLEQRWAGWTREPFTSDSRSHVSVWQKPSD